MWLFKSNVVFFHGQLYVCQVTINSIDRLDMVAKKGLWWSTRIQARKTDKRKIDKRKFDKRNIACRLPENSRR